MTTANLVGRQVGPYELVEHIGGGAMGSVYRGRHLDIGREVAVKVLDADKAENESARLRMLNEARAANRIRHPHVIDVTDIASEPSGLIYFVMELVEGASLKELIAAEGPLEPRVALDLAAQLADALAATHAEGVIHRDVKPANILVSPDPSFASGYRVILADFGIAKLTSHRETSPLMDLTREGMVIGTPTHMALEQALGCEVTPSVDIYSLGVVLYEMLTGEVPFKGPSLSVIVEAMTSGGPPVMPKRRRDVPRPLETLVRRCLSTRPERRPASALELRDRLYILANELRGAPAARRRRPARLRVQAAVLAVVVAAGLTTDGRIVSGEAEASPTPSVEVAEVAVMDPPPLLTTLHPPLRAHANEDEIVVRVEGDPRRIEVSRGRRERAQP